MKSTRPWWKFTLGEFVTVIVIVIAMVAATTFVLPRLLERGPNMLEVDLQQVRVALAAYYAENDSFPPAYGYRRWETSDEIQLKLPPEERLDPVADSEVYYWHMLYVDFPRVDLRNHYDLYDQFSTSYDTDHNGVIDHLEFDPGPEPPKPIYDEPFLQAEAFDKSTGAADRDTARPYLYIPVNRSQIEAVRRYYEQQADFKAATWDPAHPLLAGLSFPPIRYDAFVLLSVGPEEDTCGIVAPPPGVLANIKAALAAHGTPQDLYHVLGLRAYYLASRDINTRDANGKLTGNGMLDYDYRARERRGEGKRSAFPGLEEYELYVMPDPTKNLGGPVILVQEG